MLDNLVVALFERTRMCGLGEEVFWGVAWVSSVQARSRGSADSDVELLTTSVAL